MLMNVPRFIKKQASKDAVSTGVLKIDPSEKQTMRQLVDAAVVSMRRGDCQQRIISKA